MFLQSFSEPTLYLQLVQPMLEARESANNLLLGVALRLVEHPEWSEFPTYLAAVLDETGRPGLAASITPLHNILVTVEPTVTKEWLAAALRALIQDLQTGGWVVPGVMAENELALTFGQSWTQATGQAHRVNMRERTYELRRVIAPAHPAAGHLRLATPGDQEVVAAWHFAFTMEALGRGSLEEAQKAVAQRIPQGDVFLWDDHGPVSVAYRARPTPHGCTVTGVYTPPDLRGRGYASACVAGLSQVILDFGKQFCTLFTNLANPISNSIYQKIGYLPVCDFTEYRFVEQESAIVGQS